MASQLLIDPVINVTTHTEGRDDTEDTARAYGEVALLDGCFKQGRERE